MLVSDFNLNEEINQLKKDLDKCKTELYESQAGLRELQKELANIKRYYEDKIARMIDNARPH